jgi:hypothetical protein
MFCYRSVGGGEHCWQREGEGEEEVNIHDTACGGHAEEVQEYTYENDVDEEAEAEDGDETVH